MAGTEAWERLGFDSPQDYTRDRFDECDDARMDDMRVPEPTCGDCENWTRCNIQGHEDIGWCYQWSEFFEADDEQCD